MSEDIKKIPVTKENHWFLQKNLSVFEILDFFPPDSLGGKTTADSQKLPYAVRMLTIKTDAGFSFQTDIIRGKFYFRQSARSRPGTGKWMIDRNVQPGDIICIRKISDYEYTLYKETNNSNKAMKNDSKEKQPIQAKEGAFIVIDLAEFLENGIVRERIFRSTVEQHDWAQYTGERVLVKACGAAPMPPWVFMLITAKLIPYAQYIGYGEACSATTVYKKPVKSSNFVVQQFS